MSGCFGSERTSLSVMSLSILSGSQLDRMKVSAFSHVSDTQRDRNGIPISVSIRAGLSIPEQSVAMVRTRSVGSEAALGLPMVFPLSQRFKYWPSDSLHSSSTASVPLSDERRNRCMSRSNEEAINASRIRQSGNVFAFLLC